MDTVPSYLVEFTNYHLAHLFYVSCTISVSSEFVKSSFSGLTSHAHREPPQLSGAGLPSMGMGTGWGRSESGGALLPLEQLKAVATEVGLYGRTLVFLRDGSCSLVRALQTRHLQSRSLLRTSHSKLAGVSPPEAPWPLGGLLPLPTLSSQVLWFLVTGSSCQPYCFNWTLHLVRFTVIRNLFG